MMEFLTDSCAVAKGSLSKITDVRDDCHGPDLSRINDVHSTWPARADRPVMKPNA